MKLCGHTHWLNLCRSEGDLVLQKSNRLARLVDDIPNQDESKPRLVVVLGNKTKSQALRHAFGIKRARLFRNRRRSGELHLNIDPSTVHSERPILVADGTVGEVPNRLYAATDKCHVVDNIALSQSPSSISLSTSDIYGLISPFADVYCLFATDIGGFRQVACVLAAWFEHNASVCLCVPLPRLMVVTDKIPYGTRSEDEARRALLSLIAEETKCDVLTQFSALEVVGLAQKGLTPAAQFSLLKGRVLQASGEVRRKRETSHMLFSAVHFNAFFNLACDRFSQDPCAPLDFIRASRMDNPAAEDLSEHLTNFLRLVKSPDELLEFAVPMISSSLLLDSYPPDAHGEPLCTSMGQFLTGAVFSPLDVFSTIYQDALSHVGEGRVIAFENSEQIILRTGFTKLVRESFQQDFNKWVENTEMTAVELHRQNLSRFWNRYKTIDSTRTCLSCKRRQPSICLPGCKHCVCETCVELFVDPDHDDLFRIRQCFCCGTEMPEAVVVKIHPPTTGVGLLFIDGGGIKGVIPLRIMQLIETKLRELIEADLPIQTLFKVGFGVSIGISYVLYQSQELTMSQVR